MRRILAIVILVLVAGVLAVPWRHPPLPPLLDESALRAAVVAPASPTSLTSLTSPTSLTSVTSPTSPTSPTSIDELRAAIARVLEREGVPGAGIALVDRAGPIWIGGVGVADETTRAPVTADTVFRAASITKSFIGLGVMRLVEQGKLALDRPLREVVPDTGIDNAWEAVAPVTLAQVIEHTAGLDDMHFNEVFTADDALGASAALAINPAARVVRWKPGSRMAYSNVGYTLAARAIEVATGEPFDAWLRREILRPLGMRDADFRRTDALAARLATGYNDRGRAARYQPIAHRPAGALLASAGELANLVGFWLRRDGALVSAAGLDRIERCGTLPYARLDTDYGLGNGGDVSHAAVGRGHDGGLPGFLSSLRYFPSLGRGYVVLLDASYSYAALLEIKALLFAYLARDRAVAQGDPAETLAAPHEVVAVERPSAEAYRFASPRNALLGFIDRTVFGWRAEAHDDRVTLEPLFGSVHELVPAADGAYRHPGESGSSIQFARSPEGTPVMVGGFGYAEAMAWWPARVRATALAWAFRAMQLAPLWLLGVVALGVARGRRLLAFDLLLWPAVAGLCTIALPRLFFEASMLEVLGIVHPLTLAICATTILFGLAAIAGAIAALRWSMRADRPSLWSRLVPSVCAVAALGLAIWFGAHGIIGLRTWAW